MKILQLLSWNAKLFYLVTALVVSLASFSVTALVSNLADSDKPETISEKERSTDKTNTDKFASNGQSNSPTDQPSDSSPDRGNSGNTSTANPDSPSPNTDNSNSNGGGSTPPASVSCGLPRYPNPACTGVPAGTVLTTILGNYTANTPGEVVNAKHITGNLYIGAEGITVTNSQIDGTIYNNQALDHFSFTVTDTTIGPETGCIGQPGINDSRYTARRVEVRGHDDGFRVGTPGEVAIYDSYAKLCYLPPDVAPPDGSHSDGVQAYCPGGICSGLIVDHNTFDSRGIIATFMLNLAYDQLRNVTATNNMLAGGPYVLVAKWFGGPNYVISNNRIVDNSWIYAPVSGEGTCANQTWSGNTIVTIDNDYAITSTVRTQDCQY